MNIKEVKFCVTCKHHDGPGSFDVDQAKPHKCNRKGFTRDVVTGRLVPTEPLDCYVERSFHQSSKCRPEGLCWEPKEYDVEVIYGKMS